MALLRREGRLIGSSAAAHRQTWRDNFRRIIVREPQPGLLHNRVQLFDPDHSDADRGPLFIRGEVEFGVITQSAMAFAQLLGAFSLIVNQFQSISSFAAVIARLSALVGAVEKRATVRQGGDRAR